MKATVERDALLKALAHAASVVERSNTIPILSNVLIEAAGEGLLLTATDLNLQLRQTVPATVAEEGSTTVNAHLLHDVARELGVCEATATNAVLAGECLAGGHRPIERDANGKILPEGRERLRLMFRKGMKHRDIQVRLGLAASSITRERRMYEADLRARRMAPLPPPGGGERYSGARVPPAVRRRVEALYAEGYGTKKVREATGVSNTHCLRIRATLIKRLRAKGGALAGCDRDGRRVKVKDSTHRIPEHSLAKLRELLLAGMSVAAAARIAVIGGSSAYRYYHRLVAELAAEGRALPPPSWRGKRRQRGAYSIAPAIPGGRMGIERYRVLCRQMPSEQARAQLVAEAAAADRAAREAARPKTFEEQLAAVGRGERRIVEAFRPPAPAPGQSLSGSSLAAIL